MAKKKISPEMRAKLREIQEELQKLQQMVQVVADEFERRAAQG